VNLATLAAALNAVGTTISEATGCTIYERRPKACRAFSCKVFVENADGAQVEELAREHPQFRRVIREGRRRCGPLTPL
jgi:Fe-S-cluster containining protein